MSIYHTVSDHLDAYIESLGGARSTLDESNTWVSRELYHHDENIRLLGAITMHTLALDRDALAQEQGGNMTTKNTGGPAFPLPVADQECCGRFESGYGGMTLRDWFAGLAMQGLLANPGGPIQANGMSGWNWCNCSPEDAVNLAYSIADAMLKAREST